MDGNPVNFQQILREMFPRTNVENIDNIIQMVVESNPLDSVEQKIENMINLLSGDGAQGPIPDINLEPNLFTELKAIFDNVDEEFLRNFVAQKPDEYDIEDAIQELSERNDLPQKNIDPLIILDQLKSALPDADPVYLEREAYKLANLTVEEIDNFLQNSIEKNDYPTMQDYLKNKKHHDELVFYKDGFDVNKFLEVIPNPNEKFTDPHRKLTLDENATETDLQIALNFLCNRYPFIRRINIERVLKVNKNLVTVCERFDKFNKNLRKPRPLEECNEDTENIALLQVIAYLQHRQLINRELKLKDETYRQAKEEARKYNLFEKCNCCFDDELIPEETFFCLKGCGFCKDCLKRGIEVCIGNGDIHFPCFNCSSEFSLYTLQLVLPTNTFERLTQRIISEEIKAAQIDGFETCPFCSYATILPDNEKIFKCKNEECLIESCRECKHQSHIPLRCNEIEYDEDVRRRTYIENQMTEALTRTCYSCHKKFIKSNGCNKMTCQCGARMCYLCGQAVTNYSHFSENTCPLFTDDNQVNLQRIRRSVQNAKTELGNVQIKFDPSADIDAYFQ